MLTDAGRALGKYRLIAEIARGGMGIVYLAIVQGRGGFNKLVVVKELRPDLVEEPQFLLMFLDEARLAARLNHSNIVQTNEVDNDGDRYFMAMDYLDGRTLDRVRRRGRERLPLGMQLRVFCDVLAGLHYAHQLTDFDGTPLQIVHRDVSPSNVFLTFDGQAKLLDFGIAKAADAMHETQAGVLKGKIAYMSPEQARGQPVDGRADVFSVGMMMWEALAGRSMSKKQSNREILEKLISADLPRASTVNPDVPPMLDDICARAMACSRDDRYQSAAEMQDALEQYLAMAHIKVSARDLGGLMSQLFAEERRKTNALIESHVARAREGTSDVLPVIEVSMNPEHADTPTPELVSNQSSLPRRTPNGPDLSPPVLPPAPKSRLALAIGLTAVVAAGAAAIAVYLVTREPAPAPVIAQQAPTTPAATPPAAAPAPQPASAPAPAPAPRPDLVEVRVTVSPAASSVTIDGAEVANPFGGKYTQDPAMHHIHASAPGYQPVTKAVSFGDDVNLDLRLEPVPKTVHARPKPARPQPQPPTAATIKKPPEPPPSEPKPADVNPTGGTKPRRTIDPNNPYGTK